MKINKNSWHYRLVLKQVEEHRFDLLWSGKMPETRCRYFAILLRAIFPYAWCLGLIGVFLWVLINNPIQLVIFFAIFAMIAVLAVILILIGYCLNLLYKRWKKPLRELRNKFCSKIEYV